MKEAPKALIWIFAIGLPIAALAPFDVVFAAVTRDHWYARVAILALLILIGWRASIVAGLKLETNDWQAGLLAAIAVALYVAAIDGFLFCSHLRPDYVAFLQAPLGTRLAYFMMRAFNENIIYRLFVFSVLCAAATRLKISSAAVVFGAMVATQLINIGLNVTQFVGISAAELLYEMLRYVAPGVLWAWLFRRSGFFTAEIASVGCHAFLQPIFSLIF